MNSSLRPLEFTTMQWRELILDLRTRGAGHRESGAFLLGIDSSESAIVRAWLSYDLLDPNALQFDYVRLGSDAFARLWDFCAEHAFTVLGDVHTHPHAPIQSPIDRANPMIAVAGHRAIIVPRFASGDVMPSEVSVNVYLGSSQWSSYHGREAAYLIRLSKEL